MWITLLQTSEGNYTARQTVYSPLRVFAGSIITISFPNARTKLAALAVPIVAKQWKQHIVSPCKAKRRHALIDLQRVAKALILLLLMFRRFEHTVTDCLFNNPKGTLHQHLTTPT